MRHTLALLPLLLSFLLPTSLVAATSVWQGPGLSFNTASNWSPNAVPVDDASFNTATPTDISVLSIVLLNSLTFNPGAAAYTLNLDVNSNTPFAFSGAGIINNSGNTQTIVNPSWDIIFNNSATAGNNVIIDNAGFHGITFNATSSAGSAIINNSATINFLNASLGGNATLTNNHGTINFNNSSNAENATIINNVASTLSLNNIASLGNATVTNNGLLDATQLGAATWSVGSISGSGRITLGGSNMQVGSNILSTTYTGDISGSGGSLVKLGFGTLTLSGSNSYTGGTQVAQGTLNLLGSLTGNVLVNGTGILTGTGSLGNLQNIYFVRPGIDGIGTLTASNYVGSGILGIGFNGSSHGSLKVTGTADITFDVLAFGGSQMAVGQYSVLNANTLTGNFAFVYFPTSSPLLSFTTAYTPTDALVRINFATPFLPFAQTSNQRNLAANLNEQKGSSTFDFTNTISSLSVISAAQIPGAFNQISGDSLASFQNIGLQNASVYLGGMRQRVVNVSSGTSGLWAQGIGYVDSVDGDSSLGSPAYKTTTGGFQAGYDELVTDNLLFGIAGGYAKTSLDITDRNSSGNTTTIQTGIYAQATRDLWFLNGVFSYMTESNDMTRSIQYSTVNEQASSDFNSRLFSTLLEAGYTYHPRNALTLEPSLALRQTHLSQESFTETGAPGLGLTVADQSLNSWVTSLGISMRRSFYESSEHPLDLKVTTAWEHELGNADNEISAHFAETTGGSDFTVSGTPRSRNAAVIKLESRVPLRRDFELFANYSASLSAVETMQKLMGGMRWKW